MAKLKSWVVAARLRTLPLAISGFLAGFSVAARYTEPDWLVAALTLLTAVLLQVLSNFANDYGDARSGVDSDEREGPQRMVQSGAISSGRMRWAVVLFSVASFVSGTCLIAVAFGGLMLETIVFISAGLMAIAAAIKYTAGKNPYGYAGFGDLFVFIFFGLISTGGAFFLQTREMDWSVLMPAATVGLFATGVLNLNNIRDIESDRKAGKFSIPVRIGKEKAARYHAALLIAGVALATAFVLLHFRDWKELLFLLVVPRLVTNARVTIKNSGNALDPYLKHMAVTTLLFALLFAAGQLIA